MSGQRPHGLLLAPQKHVPAGRRVATAPGPLERGIILGTVGDEHDIDLGVAQLAEDGLNDGRHHAGPAVSPAPLTSTDERHGDQRPVIIQGSRGKRGDPGPLHELAGGGCVPLRGLAVVAGVAHPPCRTYGGAVSSSCYPVRGRLDRGSQFVLTVGTPELSPRWADVAPYAVSIEAAGYQNRVAGQVQQVPT